MFYVQASRELRSELKNYVYRLGNAKTFAKINKIGYDILLDYINGNHAIPVELIQDFASFKGVQLWDLLIDELIKPRASNNFFKVPKHFTPMEANLLGWILSEGHLGKFNVQISQKNRKTLQVLEQNLKKVFDLQNLRINKDRTCWKLIIQNSAFKSYLNMKYGIPIGKKSNIITVPKQLVNSDETIIFSFICGVLEGDGDFSFYIRKNKRGRYSVPRISFNSASIEFVKGIRQLLGKLNISSNIYCYKTKLNRNCYKLSVIRAEHCIKLFNKINPHQIEELKVKKKNSLLSESELLNVIKVSGQGRLFTEIRQQKKLDEFQVFLSEKYNYCVSKSSIKNWSYNLFAPPLSAIICACHILQKDCINFIPDYLLSELRIE